MSKPYAIIKTGGKQYRVATDDVIDVELLEATPGAEIEFADILFISDGSEATVGAPLISSHFVKGEVVDIVSGPKIMSMKYKASHHQYRKFGHRQHYSRVKITAIEKKESKKESRGHHGT